MSGEHQGNTRGILGEIVKFNGISGDVLNLLVKFRRVGSGKVR